MVFRSKVDAFFITFISIAILIIGAVTLLPPFIDKEASTSIVFIMIGLFIITAGFIVWTAFSIKYVFYEDYLLVKGGPFRSKIPYQTITKISQTNDIFTGYRLLASKEGLELFYTSASLGSVKISPRDVERFISELKKHCPNVEILE